MSATEVKQEDERIPTQLYTFTPETHTDASRWNRNDAYSFPRVFHPTAAPSPPHQEVAISKTRRGLDVDNSENRSIVTSPLSLFSNDAAGAMTPYTPPTPTESFIGPSIRTHVPRPPNAFMLFRSHFLREGRIPHNVERRQQNLSRICGDLWNMLDPEGKAFWHKQAAHVLNEHQMKNPGYKFTPAPRGSRRTKAEKNRSESKEESDMRLRDIREKYFHVAGQAPPTDRKKKQKKAHSVEADQRSPARSPTNTDPCGSSQIPPSAPSRQPATTTASPFPSNNTFPVPTVPRRPSTSLGFIEHGKEQWCTFRGQVHDDQPSPTFPPPDTHQHHPRVSGQAETSHFVSSDGLVTDQYPSDMPLHVPSPLVLTSAWTACNQHAPQGFEPMQYPALPVTGRYEPANMFDSNASLTLQLQLLPTTENTNYGPMFASNINTNTNDFLQFSEFDTSALKIEPFARPSHFDRSTPPPPTLLEELWRNLTDWIPLATAAPEQDQPAPDCLSHEPKHS